MSQSLPINSAEPRGRWPRRAALAAARWARRRAGLAGVLLFAALFMTPQFIDGYGGDDMLNACTPGYVRISGGEFSEFLAQQISGWMTGGRLYPIALVMTYGVHYFVHRAVVFHAIVFVLLLVDVALFYALLRAWRLEPALAGLGALFLSLLFQMRFFFDPITQFAGILPLLAGQILVSMIAFERYLATRRVVWQMASVFVFALALLTYEIAFMVVPMFSLMARARGLRWRDALAAGRPQATILLIVTAYTLGLRYQCGWNAEDAYCPRLDPIAILETTALQASSAVPLSYSLLSEHRLINMWERRLIGTWQNWAILAAAGGLTWMFLRQAGRGRQASRDPRGNCGARAIPDPQATPGPAWKWLAAVGGVIWILPGVLIAMSPKYQQAVALGLGYLPVFLQYFGMAILAIAFVIWARRALPRFWPTLRWGVVAFNALVAMITFDTNTTVACRMNDDPSQRTMSLIQSACETGLYDPAPGGATIWSKQAHPWMGGGPDLAGGHLSKMLGRVVFNVIGVPTTDWLRRTRYAGVIPPPTFVMNDAWVEGETGYVILGSVERTSDDELDDAYPVRRFRLFLQGSFAAEAEKYAICVSCPDADGKPTLMLTEWLALARLKIIERSAGRILLEGEFNGPIDLSLVQLREARHAANSVVADSQLSRR